MRTVSIRVPYTDLAVIDDQARSLGLTRTAFILRTVLGRTSENERRLTRIEDRLQRVETTVFEP